ncbi:MAG: hypothetical protein LWX83_11785 [Anaerolineae bacterium]|nr:hypothetical protein [Anaerolineae bacterium]
MSDIRCPMCGTPNPAGAEVCSNCQARLTPLQAGNLPSFDTSIFNETEDNESTDWLSSLRGESSPIEESAFAETEQDQTPIDSPETEPEWLLQIRKRHNESQSVAPTGTLPEPNDAPPDWLMQIKETHAEPAAQDEAPENPAVFPAFEETQTALPPAGAEDDQEWLRKLSDWQIPAENENAEFPAAGPAFDFASNLFEQPEGPAAPLDFSDKTPDNQPDWLENEPSPDFNAAPSGPDESLPDWLKTISAPEESVSNASAVPFTETPDEPFTEQFYSSVRDESQALAGEMPEWLQTFSSAPVSDETPSFAENEPLFTDPSQQAVNDISNQDFSWLDQIQENVPPASEPPVSGVFIPNETSGGAPSPFEGFEISDAPFANAQPFESSSLPDWLSEYGAEINAAEQQPEVVPETEGPTLPFKEDSLEWLSTSGSSAVEETEEPAEEGGAAPAQLPGWLEAMRPVESYTMSAAVLSSALEDDNHIEKSGPLAGLKATLTADGQGFEYHKPPIYSNKLHVSERQRVHASLLESIMADSGRQQVSTKKGKDRQWIPRLVIGLLLLLVTAAFLFAGGAQNNTSRDLPSIEAIRFANAVESLPEGSSVFLAVDYQPAYDGELHIAVSAVLQRLMEKNINIVLVSTQPGGPAIGEGLLIESWSNLNSANEQAAAAYSLKDKTANLGYLPGGITSLQDFALNPRLAAPAGYREVLNYVSSQPQVLPAWQSPILNKIITPANSSAILVATDSIELGRAWVEQVQPYNSATPMLLISSAQAAPLLRPYISDKQAQGMLSGMSEGLAYQEFLQQNNRHGGFNTALYAAVGFSILLVIAGAVLNSLAGLFTRTRRKKEVS